MTILITGGFGNVGRSAVRACLERGHKVVILERESAAARAGAGIARLLRTEWKNCEVVFGDIRSQADANRALARCAAAADDGGGPDAVIHLAALIPPAADTDESRTWDINVGGTETLLAACSRLPRHPRIVLASSVAIYGDRLHKPWISTADALAPNDFYAKTKEACEARLRSSGLPFVILRLSYVVWAKWLPFDPLLFSMPPETRLEVLHTEDAGRAFAAAAEVPEALGRTFNLGGGSLCRTSFRAFLDRIFRLYGLGDSSFLTGSLFAKGGFHCGWFLDSDEAEATLRFRSKSLEDYYDEVGWEVRFIAPFARAGRFFARRWLRAKSPFGEPRFRTGAGSSRARLRLSSPGRK